MQFDNWFLLIALSLLLLAFAVLQASGEERRRRIKGIGYGAVLAALAFVVYNTWGTTGVIDGIGWVLTNGLPFIGVLIVLFIGYVFWTASDATDTRAGFLEEARERMTEPVLQVAGIVSTLAITIALGMWATGMALADLLGLFGWMFGQDPMVISNLWAIIVGFIGFGGSVPILDPLIPDALRGMSTLWWFGLTLTVLGIAVAVRQSQSFRSARSSSDG